MTSTARSGPASAPGHAPAGQWTNPAILLAVLVLLPVPVRAELYSYVDAEGDVVLTNIPKLHRERLQQLEGTENTFNWQDDAGTLRRVYRVEVTRYDAWIQEAARYYSLPPALVKAVVAAESRFEPTAVSPAGAQGLMQLMSATAQDMQVRDPFDARDNIYGGTRYLRILANRFAGDLRLTIAAYNAGPEAVDRAKGVPNLVETRSYVRSVLSLYEHYLVAWKVGDCARSGSSSDQAGASPASGDAGDPDASSVTRSHSNH